MIKSKGFYSHVWSPVVGCLNGCNYCYAKRDIERLGIDFQRPVFYPERLDEPCRLRSKATIFVTHYTDLFGNWIPELYISQILDVCRHTEHDYIFITKNPVRYHQFDFPDNCILGVTIESPDKWNRAEIMQSINARKMCSVEPIMGDFTGKDFSQFELVVVGKMMYFKSEYNPSWVQSVKHDNIYYKKNVRCDLV